MNKLTREDFRFDLPTTLREVVEDELEDQRYDDFLHKKEVKPITPDSIDDLMQKIYQKIETEALATYHSNEPWALRQSALSNILKDEVVNETVNEMAHGLISPVIEWQSRQTFDPIDYLLKRLQVERKSNATVHGYKCTAARFVSRVGRKSHYSDEDIMSYLTWATEHFKNSNSYYQECQRLMQFLRRLPGDKGRELPIPMPKAPVEFNQPTFSNEDVEKLIWACVLDNIKPNMVVRLCVASVFGARRGELVELSSEDINLDGAKSSIYIRTEKGGQRKSQPLPECLLPIFDVPITRLSAPALERNLKQICKKARVIMPYRAGYHSFRRRTVTTITEFEKSDSDVSNFMRWSKPRTMLSRYKQTPVEVSDKLILERHPYVAEWALAVPYILKYNKHYQGLFQHNVN